MHTYVVNSNLLNRYLMLDIFHNINNVVLPVTIRIYSYKMKVAKVAFQKNVKYIPKKIKLVHQERQGQHESEIFRGNGDRKLYTSFVSQPAGMSIITQEDQDK